jgi:uncharacterized protein YecE (DUF72 family)
MIKVGCCGTDFKRSALLKLAEVQSTFYKVPKESTLKRWRESVPEEFEFSIKAWQLITHPPTSPTYKKAGIKDVKEVGYFKDTEEVQEAYRQTLEAAKLLRARFILFQTPKSFAQTEENLKNLCRFFEKVDREDFIFGWEARGWGPKVVSTLCESLNLVDCTDPFVRLPEKKELAYFRLHGSPPGKKLYRYKYTEEDLSFLLQCCKMYEEVYCLFNNIYMWEDALRFQRMVDEAR